MKTKTFATGLLATAAILASASVANAEYFVPPGNSAANQYTQTLPSAGGGDSANGGAGHGAAKPSKTLGHRNATKLDKQGAAGHELAEVVAATAPPAVAAASPGSESTAAGGGPKSTKHQRRHRTGKPSSGKRKGGAGARSNGSGGAGAASSGGSSAEPSGESAFGQVAGKVTGVSTSGSSILLPLAVLGTLAWAAVYGVRRRNRPVT